MSNSTSLIFKQLTPDDTGALTDLLRVFAEAFEDHQTYQSTVPDENYLRGLLSKSHFIALAALESDLVIGGLTAYVLEKYEQDRKEIYIYDLAVLESHRRQGIARGLIGQLKKIAKEKGAYVVYVQADTEDMPAIRLYESLGKKENVYHFDIPIN